VGCDGLRVSSGNPENGNFGEQDGSNDGWRVMKERYQYPAEDRHNDAYDDCARPDAGKLDLHLAGSAGLPAATAGTNAPVVSPGAAPPARD